METWRVPSGRGLWIVKRFVPKSAEVAAEKVVATAIGPAKPNQGRSGGRQVRKSHTSHARTTSHSRGVADRSSGASEATTLAGDPLTTVSTNSTFDPRAHHSGNVAGHAAAAATQGGQHHGEAAAGWRGGPPPSTAQSATYGTPSAAPHHHQQQPGTLLTANGWTYYPGAGWYHPTAGYATPEHYRQHPQQQAAAPSPQPSAGELGVRAAAAASSRTHPSQAEMVATARRNRQHAAGARKPLGLLDDVILFCIFCGFFYYVVPDIMDQQFLTRGRDALATRIVVERAMRRRNAQKAKNAPPPQSSENQSSSAANKGKDDEPPKSSSS